MDDNRITPASTRATATCYSARFEEGLLGLGRLQERNEKPTAGKEGGVDYLRVTSVCGTLYSSSTVYLASTASRLYCLRFVLPFLRESGKWDPLNSYNEEKRGLGKGTWQKCHG